MRTVLAFAALALAAHCALAAPMSIWKNEYYPSPSPYDGQSPPPPPFGGPRPPPPFGGPRPPPDDEPRRSDDLGNMLSNLLDKLLSVVTKFLGMDDGNGGFDLGRFWDRLSNALNISFSDSPRAWTTEAPPNFWGNMGNRTVDPWMPSSMPYPTGGPDSVSIPPSPPGSSPPFAKERPTGSGMSSTGSMSVMGFPSNGWMSQGGPRPMYNSMEIKNSMVTTNMKPVMTVMGGMPGKPGMQAMPAMQGVPMSTQGRPPVMPPKQLAMAGQSGKPPVQAPGKPAVAVPKPPVAGLPQASLVQKGGAVPAKQVAPVKAGGPVRAVAV